MQTMLKPLWADSFTPAQTLGMSSVPGQVQQSGWLPPWGFGDYGGAQATARAMEGKIGRMANYWEQLGSFTGSQYVYVDRFCTRFSTLQPMLGRKRKRTDSDLQADRKNPDRQKLRQHLRQNYRVCQAETETFDTIESHALLDLLEWPNTEDDGTAFLYETAMYFRLTGEWFWWIIRNGFRRPAKIIALGRNMMKPVLEHFDHGPVKHYELTIDGAAVQKIDRDDVVWRRTKNPWSKIEPYSPSLAGGAWLTTERQIETSRATRFANGGAPDVFMEIDVNAYGREIDDATLNRLQLKMKERLGMRNTHGGIIPVPPGMKPHRIADTPRELDWSTSLKDTRDSIGTLHGMNKISVGISEDMNRADTIVAMQAFYDVALNPFSSRIACAMTTGLLPFYDRNWQTKGVFLYFPNVAPIDPEEARKDREHAFGMGAWSPDEERQVQGLEPRNRPEYQSCYLPSNLIPLDSEAERPEVTAAVPGAGGKSGDAVDDDDGSDTYGGD